jgi:putative ABC transport system substrate-binding protein
MHNTIGYELLQTLMKPTKTGLNYAPVIVPTMFTERALRAKISLTIMGKFDVIVVIGDFFSGILATMYTEMEPIPTIFVGVSDPVKLGLVESLERPGRAMSGVLANTQDNYLAYAKKIAMFYPYVKRVFIPYDPSCLVGNVERGAIVGAEYLRSQGCEVELQAAFSAQEIMQGINSVIERCDAVWLLEGCTSGTLIRPISYVCWNNNKILFSSGSRGGIDLGAACSYGVNLESLAHAGVKMLHRYWEGRQSFGLQPVVELFEPRTLFINEPFLLQVGIPRKLVAEISKVSGVHMLKIWVNRPM